jgi:hypothetical protein
MSLRGRRLAVACVGAAAAGVLVAGSGPAFDDHVLDIRGSRDTHTGGPAGSAGSSIPMGAFLGSGPEGIKRIAGMENWLGGVRLRVGHTYLPGDLWSNIEGRPEFLRPWAAWRRADPDRLLVLNVPMLDGNEAGVPDGEVGARLEQGAAGRFDRHFRILAERLVGLGIPDTVIVLGWEMNGTTYTGRCAPDPGAWKAYWRRIVAAMRSVPGQRFRFDFAPSRGTDAIAWTRCYPGDDVVDIIGMDSYDQPPGARFADQVHQPYGLQTQVDFAKAHGKPVSYPEWGLFRNGDNAAYMRGMLEWIAAQRPVYHTITDYCPHGVWQCGNLNPRASRIFRRSVSAAHGTEPSRRAACLPLDPGEWARSWPMLPQLCIRSLWGRD